MSKVDKTTSIDDMFFYISDIENGDYYKEFKKVDVSCKNTKANFDMMLKNVLSYDASRVAKNDINRLKKIFVTLREYYGNPINDFFVFWNKAEEFGFLDELAKNFKFKNNSLDYRTYKFLNEVLLTGSFMLPTGERINDKNRLFENFSDFEKSVNRVVSLKRELALCDDIWVKRPLFYCSREEWGGAGVYFGFFKMEKKIIFSSILFAAAAMQENFKLSQDDYKEIFSLFSRNAWFDKKNQFLSFFAMFFSKTKIFEDVIAPQKNIKKALFNFFGKDRLEYEFNFFGKDRLEYEKGEYYYLIDEEIFNNVIDDFLNHPSFLVKNLNKKLERKDSIKYFGKTFINQDERVELEKIKNEGSKTSVKRNKI